MKPPISARPDAARPLMHVFASAVVCACVATAHGQSPPVGEALPAPAGAATMSLTAADGHLLTGLVAGDRVELDPSTVILFGLLGTWSGVLADDTTIGGLPCAGGTSVRFEMRTLSVCTLAQPFATPFGTLPQGTRVEMNDGTSIRVVDAVSDDVQLAFFAAELAAPTVWDGTAYPEGVELIFEPNGAVWLQHLRPLLHPVAEAVPCRFGDGADRALLHPDGSLARCALREPFAIHGETVPADSIVSFDAVGALVRVDLRTDWRLGEALYRAGEHVEFENGERVVVGGRFEFEDPMEHQRQSWRVDGGFYYGYPWGAARSD